MSPCEETITHRSHPRQRSLNERELLVSGFRGGIVVPEGLIAHGRGEMFDYLFGEETLPPALFAEQAAAAAMKVAERPVISVNGNLAALCAREVVLLAEETEARIEVNLFHWSEERVKSIRELLESKGAKKVLAEAPDSALEGVQHDRGKCHSAGIFSADAVLIPLEDGDRACALADMGKTVISIDLNPLSRTTLFSAISIVDEVTRAMPNLVRFAKEFKGKEERAKQIVEYYDNAYSLREMYRLIGERFAKLAAPDPKQP
jgi:4-phosphopantoate--beta-alanine ligase